MTSSMPQLAIVVLFVVATGLAIVGRALAAARPADVRLRAVAVVILAAVIMARSGAAGSLMLPISGMSLAMLALALMAALVWRVPDRMQSTSTELLEVLLVLGVIGEYLGRLFLEVKGRPIYVVDSQRRIVYCNSALATWIDLEPKRIVGHVRFARRQVLIG